MFRAHVNLAEAFQRNGDLEEASAHLAIARDLYPGHPRIPPIAERIEKARAERGW
jgi:hypothetical protein